jgi:hypothetical protein
MGRVVLSQAERHKAIAPLLGIGSDPVVVKGSKEQFLSWLSLGVRSGKLPFPAETGPVEWPPISLSNILARESASIVSGTPRSESNAF